MNTKKRIYALGFFDGVHLGHQSLLTECSRLARETGCGTAAITFDRHPRSLFSPEISGLISTVADRRLLLSRYGMEHIHVLPVTDAVMSTPWRDFLENLLREGAAGFVCGDDFRFGFRGQGTSEKLQDFCRERGLPCSVIPEQILDGIRISSTCIRRHIEEGSMEQAVKYLGHFHLLTGTVVPGKQLGRRLGIPTANLQLPRELAVPRFGVYGCLCLVDGKQYPAVTNIGVRPTVQGTGITVEPWILDYSGDLYGQEITLEFFSFLRPEQKFGTLEELKAQIHTDAQTVRDCLKHPTFQKR